MESDVRDLNYMAWKNDLAALESQKGTEWKSILKEENAAFNAALKPLKDTVKTFKKQLTLPAKDHPFTWRGTLCRHLAHSIDKISLFIQKLFISIKSFLLFPLRYCG